MKLVALLCLCALGFGCAATPATTEFAAPQDAALPAAAPQDAAPENALPSPNSMRIYIGGRSLDKSDWDPVEDQVAFAFEFVREPYEWPVGFEIGSQVGTGGKRVDLPGGGHSDVYSLVSELYGGVHKTFLRDALIQPYVGAGLTLVYASFTTHFNSFDTSDDDVSAGLYIHGGLETHLAKNLFVGVDLRAVGGTDINLFGNNGDADYGQVAVFLGVGF